jgi:hypothetical protein
MGGVFSCNSRHKGGGGDEKGEMIRMDKRLGFEI